MKSIEFELKYNPEYNVFACELLGVCFQYLDKEHHDIT